MKKRMDSKELSAYIDGETKAPEDVGRRIEQSDDLAKRYEAYRKIRTYLRELPQPDVRPGFAGRVIAALRIEDATPVRATNARWAWGMATASAAAVLLVGFALFATPVQDVTTIARQTNASVEAAEAVLVAELERQLIDESVSDSVLVQTFYPEEEANADITEEILVSLANSDWLDAFNPAGAGSFDYAFAVEGLKDAELDVFQQLLTQYARETLQAGSPKKG